MFAPLFFTLVVSASPAPSATMPPEIYHMRISPFCSALREHIGPAIGGLLMNERLMSAGNATLIKLAHDYVNSSSNAIRSGDVQASSAMQLDTSHLVVLADDMLHNIDVIDKALARKAPDGQAGSDGAALAEMKARLEKVKNAEAAAANLLAGIAQTQATETFMNAGNKAMSAGLGDELSNKSEVQLFSGNALTAMDQASAREQSLAGADNWVLQTPVGDFYKTLLLTQAVTKQAEREAAAVVIGNAKKCR